MRDDQGVFPVHFKADLEFIDIVVFVLDKIPIIFDYDYDDDSIYGIYMAIGWNRRAE